ncbi:MAG: hypothetical protein D6788_10755, partial [Planctomycetota bacterium]
MTGQDGQGETTRLDRRQVLAGGAAVVLVFALCLPARLWRPDKVFTLTENIQIAEAQAWWNERLDLPERKWDSALYRGKVYSHFPPMFSILSAAVVPFFDGVPHWLIVLGLALPIPLLAYALFLRRTGSAPWAAILSVGLVCGTSVLPVVDKMVRGAHPYFVNQSLALIGLLIVLIEACGKRRLLWMGAGLALAAWSRQLTIAYLLPVAYLAFRTDDRALRRKRALGLAALVAVLAGVPMVLNTLKFGHPLESGYRYIYADRPEDAFSRDAKRYGLFSLHYVPRNLYYANLGFPEVHRIERGGKEETYLRPNHMGTGIWWTTPLLLFVLLDGKRILTDRTWRMFLAAAGLVYAGLMVYHSTGFDQRGFNRYSLDYIP